MGQYLPTFQTRISEGRGELKIALSDVITQYLIFDSECLCSFYFLLECRRTTRIPAHRFDCIAEEQVIGSNL